MLTKTKSIYFHFKLCDVNNVAGWTALHCTCLMDREEILLDIVEWLVTDCGIDPAIKSNNGTSPIHFAISKGHSNVVHELLMTHNLTASKDDSTGYYPLHTAAHLNQVECVKVLVRHGANVLLLTETHHPTSAFHLAASSLILHKLNSSTLENFEHEFKIMKTINVLLKYLKPESILVFDDGKFGTILHLLAGINHEMGLKKIICPPFLHPVNVLNTDTVTPFQMALETRSMECVDELLNHEVDVSKIHPILNLSPIQILFRKAKTILDIDLGILEKMLKRGEKKKTYKTFLYGVRIRGFLTLVKLYHSL